MYVMTATKLHDLDQLWAQAPAPSGVCFEPRMVEDLPEPARRYLLHAIAPGTLLARSVRLRMRGEIFLNRWIEFEAEQVWVADRGFVWAAHAHRGLLSIKGFDRFVDDIGQMRWRLFGLIPVMSADGPDISRSARGRYEAECVMVPSVFFDPGTRWSIPAHEHADLSVCRGGREAQVHLSLAADGAPRALWLNRWGNPDGGDFREVPFGMIPEREKNFGGFTIASELRAGWHYRNGEFAEGGEFFRAEILAAEYR